MPFLIAAVILACALGLLNLVLSLAIVRRMRSEAAERDQKARSGPPTGTAIPSFTVSDIDGGEVSADALLGAPAVLAFLSTTCSACGPSLPHLVDYANQKALKPEQVIAIIDGGAGSAEHLLAELSDVATVLFEPEPKYLAGRFSVNGYPTFVLIDSDGMVVQTKVGGGPLVKA